MTVMMRKLKNSFLRRRKIAAEPEFHGSSSYWDERYRSGFTSGSGSYGRLARFKAAVVNSFANDKSLMNAVEFGCGDGNQLRMLRFSTYVGYDPSDHIISHNRQKFASDAEKRFYQLNDFEPPRSPFDVALSLDVILHLVEDDVYEEHMRCVFDFSKYSIVYSSNFDCAESKTPHVRHRKFTRWVEQWRPFSTLLAHIPNEFPKDPGNPNTTSFADFYIYRNI